MVFRLDDIWVRKTHAWVERMKFSTKRGLLPALSIVALALNLTGIPQAHGGSFLTNAPMITPRAGHIAILLRNGKVLVAGGSGNFKVGVDDPERGAVGSYDNVTGKLIFKTIELDSAELYDPATRSWSRTGSMIHPCSWPKAVLLADGRVFVTGFFVSGSSRTQAPEIYDPATGRWAETSVPKGAKYSDCMTVLTNGSVLAISGNVSPLSGPPEEAYNPTNEIWTSISAMATKFESPTATLLQNGEVLVSGVNGLGYIAQMPDPKIVNQPVPANAELFHPATGTWTVITNFMTRHVNSRHTATLLPNGKVLFVVAEWFGKATNSPQIFDPASGTWSATGDMNERRDRYSATLLADGKVFVVGGIWNGYYPSSAELYDSEKGTWETVSAHPTTARWDHTATLLSDGNVLIAGGLIKSG
jgi:hypothetical protein